MHVIVQVMVEELANEGLLLVTLRLGRLARIEKGSRHLFAEKRTAAQDRGLTIGGNANDGWRLHAHVYGKSQGKKRKQ